MFGSLLRSALCVADSRLCPRSLFCLLHIIRRCDCTIIAFYCMISKISPQAPQAVPMWPFRYARLILLSSPSTRRTAHSVARSKGGNALSPTKRRGGRTSRNIDCMLHVYIQSSSTHTAVSFNHCTTSRVSRYHLQSGKLTCMFSEVCGVIYYSFIITICQDKHMHVCFTRSACTIV